MEASAKGLSHGRTWGILGHAGYRPGAAMAPAGRLTAPLVHGSKVGGL